VPVALCAATFLPTVGKIAERHLGLKLIVDHMGVPRASADEYPFRSLHPHLHRCFDAFGPERMFWGTDITRMPCSWRQCVTLFTEKLPWLKSRDLELVMGEALCNWLGWPLPAGAGSRRHGPVQNGTVAKGSTCPFSAIRYCRPLYWWHSCWDSQMHPVACLHHQPIDEPAPVVGGLHHHALDLCLIRG
jgi:hypothetical protein